MITWVAGYDPGGNGAHGVASICVSQKDGRWIGEALKFTLADCLRGAVAWLDDICAGGQIVAVGIDTLTEWSCDDGGWRPADRWLRKTYPQMKNSVVCPNSLYSSMTVNGAAFLTRFRERFERDGTMICEAHPKVCFFALTGHRPEAPEGSASDAGMQWLCNELGIGSPEQERAQGDHCFDAALAALAALRGLNGDWTLDLHALPWPDESARIKPFGNTHFWWPELTSIGTPQA